MDITRLQWRLNEPGEGGDGNRVRWTKVHRVSVIADDVTICRRIIPQHPYDVRFNADIPDASERCIRCEHVGSNE